MSERLTEAQRAHVQRLAAEGASEAFVARIAADMAKSTPARVSTPGPAPTPAPTRASNGARPRERRASAKRSGSRAGPDPDPDPAARARARAAKQKARLERGAKRIDDRWREVNAGSAPLRHGALDAQFDDAIAADNDLDDPRGTIPMWPRSWAGGGWR